MRWRHDESDSSQAVQIGHDHGVRPAGALLAAFKHEGCTSTQGFMPYRKQSRTPGRHNQPQPLHCPEGVLCDVTKEKKPVVHPFLLRLTQPYFTLHETPQQNMLPNTFAHILLLAEGGLCCLQKTPPLETGHLLKKEDHRGL